MMRMCKHHEIVFKNVCYEDFKLQTSVSRNMHIFYHSKYHQNITKLRTSGGRQASQSGPIIFLNIRCKVKFRVTILTERKFFT